jgi:hypothetical protein
MEMVTCCIILGAFAPLLSLPVLKIRGLSEVFDDAKYFRFVELIMISSFLAIVPIYPEIEQYIPQDLFLKWIWFLVYGAAFTFALAAPLIVGAGLCWVMWRELK